MITDIFVIRDYFRIGDTTSAYTLMAMIGLSITIQLIIAYVQVSQWKYFHSVSACLEEDDNTNHH